MNKKSYLENIIPKQEKKTFGITEEVSEKEVAQQPNDAPQEKAEAQLPTISKALNYGGKRFTIEFDQPILKFKNNPKLLSHIMQQVENKFATLLKSTQIGTSSLAAERKKEETQTVGQKSSITQQGKQPPDKTTPTK